MSSSTAAADPGEGGDRQVLNINLGISTGCLREPDDGTDFLCTAAVIKVMRNIKSVKLDTRKRNGESRG